jgi:flagellar hook-length control protein FliK
MNPGMLATSVSGMSEGNSANPLLSLINHATAAGSENLSSSNLLSTSTLEKAVPGSPLNAAKNLPSQVLLSEKMQEIPTATRIKENLQGESVLGQSANSSIPSQEQSNALAEGQGPMLEIQTVEVPSPGALRTHEFSKLAAKKEIAGTGVHLGAPKSETQTEEGKLIFSTTIKPSGFFEAELHPTLDGSLGPSTAKNVFKPSDSAGFGPKPLDRPTSPVAGAFIEKNLASQTPWSAIDKASVVSQLIDKARLLAGKHNGELVISLKPEFLGKLCLQAAMVENELVATITTESNQVRQMLESHLPALQTSLQEQGLQVSKISVVQGNDINFSDSQQQPGNRQNPRTGGQASSMLTENQVRTEEVQDLPLHLQMQASLTSRGINLLA